MISELMRLPLCLVLARGLIDAAPYPGGFVERAHDQKYQIGLRRVTTTVIATCATETSDSDSKRYYEKKDNQP